VGLIYLKKESINFFMQLRCNINKLAKAFKKQAV
jgi:hypothetical protein